MAESIIEKAGRISRTTTNILRAFDGASSNEAARILAERVARAFEPRLNENEIDDAADIIAIKIRNLGMSTAKPLIDQFSVRKSMPVQASLEPEPEPPTVQPIEIPTPPPIPPPSV